MKMKRPKSAEEAAAALISEARLDRQKCEEEKASISTRLAALESGYLPAVVKKLGKRWLTNTVPTSIGRKAIDDPIYGHIVLEKALATLTSHPLLQRLARVKQLSFSFVQFPSARHSRLSHTLGVAKNAERALSGILGRGVYYVVGESQPLQFDRSTVEQRHDIILKAQAAALLHDVGHGPFGHALDTYAGIKSGRERPDKHYTEVYIREFLGPTLRSVGIDEAAILALLGPDRSGLKGFDHLIGDVIDSSLDVDRMDYLMRDAHMTGLMMGFINTDALIDFMRPVLDQESFILAYDEEALGYMEHLMLARDAMYFNCYEHRRKKAAERIFTRLVKSLVDDHRLGLSLDDLFALADEELTSLVSGIGSGNNLAQHLVEELMGDLDYVKVYEVAASKRGGATLPGIVDNWLNEVLLEENEIAYITRPANWEEKIAQNSIGRDRAWQIQVVLPNAKVSQLQQSSATKLLRKDSSGRYEAVDFFEVSGTLKETLERMNLQRQTIMVMCPAGLPSIEREHIQKAASLVFGLT
jgi:HD superfamily phosphohydrolase